MQAYIPEFILAGLAMLLLLAETFCKKTPKFIFGLIGAAGTLAMLPFYMEGLYDNIYIILALVATAVTLLLSVDFRAVINLSSNDSKSQCQEKYRDDLWIVLHIKQGRNHNSCQNDNTSHCRCSCLLQMRLYTLHTLRLAHL